MRQVYRLLGLVKRYGAAPGRHRLRARPGPRRRLGGQDRRHAGEGHRERPGPATEGRVRAGPGPLRPRPRRIPPQRTQPAKPDWMTVIDGGALTDSEQDQEGLW